jgi:hypothetical protein
MHSPRLTPCRIFTMSPVHPWIAQVVGVCLSFYLGESPQSVIEVEDDGASLHFNVKDFGPAAIVTEVDDSWASSRAENR